MNSLLFYFAGGVAFWWGLGAILIAAGFTLIFREISGFGRIALELLLLAGGVLILLAGPPLPGWVYFLWAVVVLSCVASLQPGMTSRQPRITMALCLAVPVFAAALLLYEIPYIRTPAIPATDGPSFVIGDSLSSGIAIEERTWPEILEQDHGWPLHNYASPGARLQDAISRQAPRIEAPDALVFLMIGGNDLIRRTPLNQFEDDLDELIEAVNAPGRTLVMVELPSIPGYRGYTRAQRAAVRRHDLILIPRRHLAALLATPDQTLDGLHFSDSGHLHWANLILAQRNAGASR